MEFAEIILNELLETPRLTPVDRNVYIWAFLLQPPSIRRVAEAAGVSWHTASRACRRLAQAEWMRLEGPPQRKRPVAVVPARCQDKLAERLEKEYGMARNKGEFLMKRNLDLWVRSREFLDNARPDLLTSPTSDHALEYDRFYYGFGVAFEFNGPQHYDAGPGFDEQTHKEIRTRDLIKQALSKEAGVQLVTVTGQDLAPDIFPKLLPETLPRNWVDTDGPYFRALSRLSKAYAAKAGRPARHRKSVADCR